MEFPLIHVSVLITRPFGIYWGKYLETYLSTNCHGCYDQINSLKITSEVSANKFPDSNSSQWSSQFYKKVSTE